MMKQRGKILVGMHVLKFSLPRFFFVELPQ
jgi:hypothetical protein